MKNFLAMLLVSLVGCGTQADQALVAQSKESEGLRVKHLTADPNTLDRIHAAITAARQTYPDLRVGQIIMTASELTHRDLSYVEDEDLAKAIEQYGSNIENLPRPDYDPGQ